MNAKPPPVLVACLLLLASCRGPEVRIHAQEKIGTPLFLVVHLPQGPHQAEREQLLRENLQASLGATLALAAPEDRQERDAVLAIEVSELSRSGALKATVADGAANGAVDGTMTGLDTGVEATSSDQSAKDNLALVVVGAAAGATVGIVGGTVGGTFDGAVRGAYHDTRLGYRPKHLVCKVSYAPDGRTPPHPIGTTDAWAVVKEMRPMSSADAHDVAKLHREEARALAVLVERILQDAGAL